MLFHNKDTYQDTARQTCHSGTDGGCYATQENCNKTVQIKQATGISRSYKARKVPWVYCVTTQMEKNKR